MQLTSRVLSSIVVALSMMGLSAQLFANDAVILLNQMNDALHTLEYQGKLVYLKDGEAYNLSIKHVIENGAEKEIVTLLDENSDDYVRESSAFSLSALPKITPQMQQVYSFDIGGMGKVAGRPCRIVLARPKDRKRYLQKYCIDLDRSVVLKYSLINQHHQPVERFMFTDFEVISTPDEDLEESQLQHSVTALAGTPHELANRIQTGSALQESASGADILPLTDMDAVVSNGAGNANRASADTGFVRQPQKAEVGGVSVQHTEWFFDPLPAGFRIVSSDKVKSSSGEDDQIVISDGLSSVSVFFSTNNQPAKAYKPIRSGALNILTRNYQGYTVTLVGEVPESTLQDIYEGIKRKRVTIDKQ